MINHKQNWVFFIFVFVSLLVLPAQASAQFYEQAVKNISNSDSVERRPVVVWNGYFGVAWVRGNDIRFARLDENGNVVSGPATVYTSPVTLWGEDLHLVYGENKWLIAFAQRIGGQPKIYLLTLNPGGSPIGSAQQITTGSNYYHSPDIAWSGNEFGLAYVKETGGSGLTFTAEFQLLNNSGNKIGAPVAITSGTGYLSDINVCWSGKFFAVSWIGGNDKILLQRFRTSGAKKGGIVTVFNSNNSNGPGGLKMITRDAKAYAIVFSWRSNSNPSQQVYFMRLRRNGKRKGVMRRISHDPSSGGSTEPAFVYDRLTKRYGIFWTDHRDQVSGMSANIYAAKLNNSGGIIVTDYAFTFDNPQDRWPEVATSGDAALLLFTRMVLPNMQIYVSKMIVEAW